MHRIWKDVELWNGNRETWRDLFAGRNSVVYWAFRGHLRHRRQWPNRFDGDSRLVRLRSQDEVRRWLETVPEE
jgi:hypothetical protein